MSSAVKIAAPALLLALLTGCSLRPHRTPPPVVAQAPSLPPSQMAALISPLPPVLPVVWQRPIKLDTAMPPEPKPEVAVVPRRRPVHHRPRPGEREAAQQEPKAPAPAASDTVAQTEQTAAATTAQPAENSPIGQLSTANPDANIADRNALAKQIDDTENALNAIKRPLDAEEQKTVVQIRAYIGRARDALKNDDLDGARIQFTKAHLLLLELTR